MKGQACLPAHSCARQCQTDLVNRSFLGDSRLARVADANLPFGCEPASIAEGVRGRVMDAPSMVRDRPQAKTTASLLSALPACVSWRAVRFREALQAASDPVVTARSLPFYQPARGSRVAVSAMVRGERAGQSSGRRGGEEGGEGGGGD